MVDNVRFYFISSESSKFRHRELHRFDPRKFTPWDPSDLVDDDDQPTYVYGRIMLLKDTDVFRNRNLTYMKASPIEFFGGAHGIPSLPFSNWPWLGEVIHRAPLNQVFIVPLADPNQPRVVSTSPDDSRPLLENIFYQEHHLALSEFEAGHLPVLNSSLRQLANDINRASDNLRALVSGPPLFKKSLENLPSHTSFK